MRVLVLADDDGLFARGAELLRSSGHEVLACHEAGAAADRWPCSAITDTCPLEGVGVDAAVALRRGASRVEAGIGCVVRQRIPLVVAGSAPTGSVSSAAGDGLPTYAAAVVDGVGPELVAALEEVSTAPLSELSAIVTEEVRAVGRRLGVEADLRAEVRREGRGMRVGVSTSTDITAAQRTSLGQRAFSALRAAVPAGAVDSIDVTVVTAR